MNQICQTVQHDGNLAKLMHKTPRTPTKMGYQTTPRKSDRKRSLFQPSTPTNSEDLGPMSPLSASSCGSVESYNSPHFSPNGLLATPPRTINMTPVRHSPRLSTMKLNVKSSLFPDLKKMHKSNQISDPQIDTPIDSQTDSLIKSPKPTKLGIKPLSCDSFYGPPPPPPKARTCLFIDTLEAKDLKNRKRSRSPSRDSVGSNRSFVSGSGHRRTSSGGSFKGSGGRSRSKNRRAPHVGVWHNIKKPKKMKKHVRAAKPLVSPMTRIKSMMKDEEETEKKIEVKPKRLFEEKPKNRRAVKKRRLNSETEDCEIEDPFPDSLIKRKKLPTRSNTEPKNVYEMVNTTPDPNKKFMKYGSMRKATFTISDNMKLQIADGIMKLQSPKKRRRLCTPKRDVILDFADDEEPNTGIKENVENILNRLQIDKDLSSSQVKQLGSPCKVQIEKITDTQLFNILENPATKISFVEATPTKTLTEVQSSPEDRVLTNLSNVFNIDNNHTDSYIVSADEQNSSSPKDQSKLYSLFYKENWNKANNIISDITNIKSYSNKKKSIKVPDDQYLLDAGQKSIGIVTCAKCGVMYQAGDYADEATHNRFHHHLPELKFTGWANERVVGKFQDGRVIMIINSDPKAWWAKVSKIVDIVDQELGFPEASVNLLYYKTVYLYISDKAKQIVGCLIAEECKTAYKMFPPLEGIDVDSCSKDPSPCKIGISRIWTALSHRRRGVASRLIECLQRTFLFGEIVPLDYVAFSVPSPSGKLLAQKVTGKYDFLVYGF